jgi:hypothetical protein
MVSTIATINNIIIRKNPSENITKIKLGLFCIFSILGKIPFCQFFVLLTYPNMTGKIPCALIL